MIYIITPIKQSFDNFIRNEIKKISSPQDIPFNMKWHLRGMRGEIRGLVEDERCEG